jgi:heme-degrading monooxygenase HmoA
MIARHWTGLAKREKADEYILHLKNDTFKQLANIDGFISASILQRALPEGIEFLIITEWASLDAIKKFAGNDAETAVVPKLVQKIMIRYDEKVRHYEVNYPVQV